MGECLTLAIVYYWIMIDVLMIRVTVTILRSSIPASIKMHNISFVCSLEGLLKNKIRDENIAYHFHLCMPFMASEQCKTLTSYINFE